MNCGSEESVESLDVGHASGGSRSRLQCGREEAVEAACGFCFMLLVGDSIHCSGCGEKLRSETLCMGSEAW